MRTTDGPGNLQATLTRDDVCGQLHTFSRALYARALGFERTRADAHDLVQETFERAIRYSRRFIAGTNLLGWLTTIMRNAFTDKARHRQVRRRALAEVQRSLTPPPGTDDEDECGDGAPLREALTRRDVVAALGELPGIYRRPFQLFHIQGLNQRAIGALLGIPVATVGTRLYRARLMMRKALLRRHGGQLIGVSSSAPAAPLPLPPPAAAASPLSLVRPTKLVPPVFGRRPTEGAPRSGARERRGYAEPVAAFSRLPGTC
jgi:RNA polymerase sigma-70 factor (ECF subfamily)